jgi:hypothetical protein
MNVLSLISIILFFVFIFMHLHNLESKENFYEQNSPNNMSTKQSCEVLNEYGQCLNNNYNNTNNTNNFDLSKCPKIPDMSNYVLKSSIPPKMKCPPCICPKVDIKAESFNAEKRCPEIGYYKAQTTTKAPGIEEQVQKLIKNFLEKDREELHKLQVIQESLKGTNLVSYDALDDLNESLSDENKKLLEQLHALQNPVTTPNIPKINIVNKINEMLLDINQNPEDLQKLKEIKNILMSSDLETNVELEGDKHSLIERNKQMKNELDEMRKIIQDLQNKKQKYKRPRQTYSNNNTSSNSVKPLNYNNYLNNSLKQLNNNNKSRNASSLNKLIDHMMDGSNNGNETKSPNSLKGYNSSNAYKLLSDTNEEVCA